MEHTSNIAKGMKRLMWIGVAASWTAMGLYFYKFAPGHWFELSSDDSRWANFGTFYGGVAGPFFSFLAFIGVVITVVLQAKQLDTMRAQANFEEQQRLLSSMSTTIDGILHGKPLRDSTNPFLRDQVDQTFFSVISRIGSHMLMPTEASSMDAGYHQQKYETVLNALDPTFIVIGIELQQLAWALNRYQEQGGNENVIEFYKFRYVVPVCWLDAMGKLSTHDQVQAFFKPKELAEQIYGEATSQAS